MDVTKMKKVSRSCCGEDAWRRGPKGMYVEYGWYGFIGVVEVSRFDPGMCDGWRPPVDSFTNLLAKQTVGAHPVIIADGVSSAHSRSLLASIFIASHRCQRLRSASF